MTQSYTPEDIAHLLQVSKLTVYDLIKKGDIPAYRVGRQMRIDAVDFERYKSRGKAVKQTGSSESDVVAHPIIISGQDNCLDLLARALEKRTDIQPLRSYASSMDGLISMYEGKTDIASVHLLDGETNEYNVSYVRKLLVSHSFKIIRFIKRDVGFYVARGNPKQVGTWEDVLNDQLILANREAGAGARVLVDEQLRMKKINRLNIKGYDHIHRSHLEVASEIQSGRADVGVGVKQVADLVQIGFVPIIEEQYDLVLMNRPKNREVNEHVQTIMRDETFTEQLRALHYLTEDIGTVLYEQ